MNKILGENNTKIHSSVRLNWENLICNITMQLSSTNFFNYYFSYFEKIIDSHEVVRKKTEISCSLPPVSSNGNPCKTIVQYKNQDIDIDVVQVQKISTTTKIPCYHLSTHPPTHSYLRTPVILSFQECYRNGIIQYVNFWDWLFFQFI